MSNTPLTFDYCYVSFADGEEKITEGVGTFDNLDSVFEAIKKNLREDGDSQLGKIEIWIEGHDERCEENQIEFKSYGGELVAIKKEEEDEGSKCGECGVSTQGRKIRSLWNNTLCEKCGEEDEEEEEEEEEEKWEYHNYGTEKTPAFGEISYQVAGGGLQNGNAYATIELKNGMYYYCEYGNNPKRRFEGDKIIWSDEIYDKQNPYECRNFNILD